MVDMDEISSLSGSLWMQKDDGKSFKVASILLDAIKVLADSQNEIQKDLEWIKRKLKEEI
jgi:hypothetical protein